MAGKGVTFVANNREYVYIFEKYAQTRRGIEKIWLANDVIPRLMSLYGHEDSMPKTAFKVLAVGSCGGTFDCLLLNALLSHAPELIKGKQVIYTVVEPNAIAIDVFKDRIALHSVLFDNVIFNFVSKHIEEFLETNQPERYDFVHFMHVLYYFESEEEVLKSAYEKFLASPGCILIATGSEGDIWTKLLESFRTKIPALPGEQHFPTNKELYEIYKRNGWAFEIVNTKFDLEITEVFNEGDPAGKSLLQFLSTQLKTQRKSLEMSYFRM